MPALYLAAMQMAVSLRYLAAGSVRAPDVVVGLLRRGHQVVCKGRQGGLRPVPPV